MVKILRSGEARWPNNLITSAEHPWPMCRNARRSRDLHSRGLEYDVIRLIRRKSRAFVLGVHDTTCGLIYDSFYICFCTKLCFKYYPNSLTQRLIIQLGK